MYRLERSGVAVSKSSRTVRNANRLTQVVLLGDTGKQAVNRVNSPAMTIHENG
jgi:hypothetical protein